MNSMNKYDEWINYMKQNGIDVTEPDICRAMASIGKIFKPGTILDPNAGIGELLYYCSYGQYRDGYSSNEEYINAGRDIDHRVNFIHDNFLNAVLDKKYDLIISQIPFSYGLNPIEGIEEFLDIKYLEKIFKALNDNGVLIALLPGRFLCEEYSIAARQEILNRYSLEMIIELPYESYKVKGHDANIVVVKNAKQVDKVLMCTYDGEVQNIISKYLKNNGEEFINKNLLYERWDKHYHNEEFNWLNYYTPSYYKTIGEMSEVSHGPMLFNKNQAGEVIILNKSNIKNGMILSTFEDKYVSDKDLDELGRFVLQDGDIVVKMKMDIAHNIVQYNNQMPRVMASFDYIVIRPNDEYLKEFISTIAGRKFLEDQFNRILKGPGKNLAASDIENTKIPLFDIRDIRLIEKVNTNTIEEQEILLRLNQIQLELSDIRFKNEKKEKEELLRKSKDLAGIEELLLGLLDYVTEIKNTADEINGTVKESNKIIKDIYAMVQELHSIQDNILERLNSINSEEEKEETYKRLSDKIWDLIDEKYKLSVKNRYKEIENDYMEKFTHDGWNKLDDETRRFLITSKVVYYDLNQYGNIIDFSPCCIALTKALEREIFLNVFIKMKAYFMSNRDIDLGYLPDGLVFSKKDKNAYIYNYKFDDKFTLGSVSYLLASSFEPNRLNDDFTRSKKKDSVKEFLGKYLFREECFKNDNELDDYINSLSKDIDDITKKYRNESAHKNKVKREQAEDCYELIIRTDRILIKFVSMLR